MDRGEILRQLLVQPLDWVTVAPLMGGVALGLGAWAAHPEPGLYVAGGVILVLISAGIYLNRLVFGWNDNRERLVNAWREAVEKARDAELDALYRGLQEDGDPRTETLLKDLRTLTKALLNEQSDAMALCALDIVSDVDRLFQLSVDYLRESLDLWRTASQVNRESIRSQLLKQRELLIQEVEKSLENLGDTLGGLKRVAVTSGSAPELAALRDELKARLKLAETVEERIKGLREGRLTVQEEAVYGRQADS